MIKYRERIADKLLENTLDAMGAVLIEGPKACGKTTTAEHQSKTVLYVDNPAKVSQYKQMAETNILNLLDGEKPRLLDEWQLIPQIWDSVRFYVDHTEGNGQFILTGSAVPADRSSINHSGAGRFGWIIMRTMSLWESGESSGAVSLEKLFSSVDDVSGHSEVDMNMLSFLICRGGWPKAVNQTNKRSALAQVYAYIDAIARYDLSRVDNVQRKEDIIRKLIRSYARHQGTQASIDTILTDINADNKTSLSGTTVESYISALKKIFVVEDMPAWNPNLRSKTAIRTSDTRYFVDPSVAVASLGLGPDDLINDLNTMGLLLETMCIRDLRIYTDAIGGSVYHYRDKNGLECDAVVHLRNGHYGLIEIKLGGETLINEGAATLCRLASKIDTDKMHAPSFLMVLTGLGDYAYKRTDGVCVVPIGCLKN